MSLNISDPIGAVPHFLHPGCPPEVVLPRWPLSPQPTSPGSELSDGQHSGREMNITDSNNNSTDSSSGSSSNSNSNSNSGSDILVFTDDEVTPTKCTVSSPSDTDLNSPAYLSEMDLKKLAWGVQQVCVCTSSNIGRNFLIFYFLFFISYLLFFFYYTGSEDFIIPTYLSVDK